MNGNKKTRYKNVLFKAYKMPLKYYNRITPHEFKIIFNSSPKGEKGIEIC